MVAVIDYDAGNIRSVINALGRLGAEYVVTSDTRTILSSDRVIMPGVGEARCAMESLKERGLDNVVRSLECPVLGICVGMQLMCSCSEEGNVDCLGIFDTEVRLLKADRPSGVKVPHTGWNSVTGLEGPLFQGIGDGTYMYFVHSYAAGLCAETVARCENGIQFSAALSKGNFYGVQFHPEKSGPAGERLLRNFLLI